MHLSFLGGVIIDSHYICLWCPRCRFSALSYHLYAGGPVVRGAWEPEQPCSRVHHPPLRHSSGYCRWFFRYFGLLKCGSTNQKYRPKSLSELCLIYLVHDHSSLCTVLQFNSFILTYSGICIIPMSLFWCFCEKFKDYKYNPETATDEVLLLRIQCHSLVTTNRYLRRNWMYWNEMK